MSGGQATVENVEKKLMEEAKSLLDGVFIVRADDEIQPFFDDRIRFVMDADLRFRIRHTLNKNKDVHSCLHTF